MDCFGCFQASWVQPIDPFCVVVAYNALGNILGGTALAGDTPIELTTDADFTASLDPSAGACRNSPSALLVEVCYYRAAPAPDCEDAHVPFAIEAGQGY